MRAGGSAEERPGHVFELGNSVLLAWTVLAGVLFVLAAEGVSAFTR